MTLLKQNRLGYLLSRFPINPTRPLIARTSPVGRGCGCRRGSGSNGCCWRSQKTLLLG
ncbi:MAG: hypothetical protein ACR2LR_09280 [Hassallia sp.]